ncbi:MAG: glycosyl transferase, partial [Paraprevotella sp.]|nr:glycosyl transferase [Paraprevotella sp.]
NYNGSEVVDAIKDSITSFASLSTDEVKAARENAYAISEHALWNNFIVYYFQAYDMALQKAKQRMDGNEKR